MCTYVRVYVRVYVSACVRVYVRTCVCVYVCEYVRAFMYVCLICTFYGLHLEGFITSKIAKGVINIVAIVIDVTCGHRFKNDPFK